MTALSTSLRRWPRRFGLWLLLALCAPLLAHAAAGAGAVEFRVQADADKVARGQEVWVTLEVHNPGPHPAKLLRWKLPLSTSDTPDFIVERDGDAAPYVGRRLKRAAPTAADYIELAPGETKRFRVDLSQRYDFSRSADYTVGFRYADPQTAAKRARAAVLRIEGRPSVMPPAPSLAKVVTGTSQFIGCSAQRQADLAVARTAASDYATNVRTYLAELRNGARYTTWMGAYDNARYALVTSHFTAIGGYIDAYSPLAFDCTCTDDYYAYVYPGDATRTIYLCNAFWSAPLTGTDSRAGTLIHEASHFTVHGGTDDFVYGQAGAMQLAINNPANAVMNADSHEYLAENTPVREGNTPSPPRNVAAQPGNAQATLSFDAPLSNGGAAITNYQYTANNGMTWTTLSPADATSPVTIGGLANGTGYNLRLRAVNANGNGGASASTAVTPNAVVDLGTLALAFTRTAPATPLLYSGLDPQNPLATWVLSVSNNGAVPMTGLLVDARVSGALGALAWQCTAAGITCAPATGSGSVALEVALGAGQTLTVAMTAQVNASRRWAQLDARASLGNASVSHQRIEAANASALFRGTFE